MTSDPRFFTFVSWKFCDLMQICSPRETLSYLPSLASLDGGLQRPKQLQRPGHAQAWRGASAAINIPDTLDSATEPQDQEPTAARGLQLQQAALPIFPHEDTPHSKTLLKGKWWTVAALRILGTRETMRQNSHLGNRAPFWRDCLDRMVMKR